MSTLGYSEIDGLEFYSKDAAMEQLERFVEQHNMEFCHEYGEPGYSLSDKHIIVFGDYWCRCKNNPFAGQQKRGFNRDGELVKPEDLHDYSAHHPLLWERWEEIAEFEWNDEWYIDYENDKCYRTTADSYMWQPSAVWNEDICDMMTPDDNVEVWIEWATSDPASRVIPRHIVGKSDLEDVGFREYNGVYENGWHPGQTDDPSKIVDAIRDELGEDGEVLFWLTETSQFYVKFEALVRYPERIYVSSNSFGGGIQLQDAVNWLDLNKPELSAELRRVYPELDRALETVTGTSSWIDAEAAGVDPEFDSWCIDWIESNTPIQWEEGEPVAFVRDWEDDSDD